MDLSLEELANVEITSVSKRAERLSDAAASVFVITAGDVRRMGARTLPEALRLAPNLHVAQASASGYAISARGSAGNTSNKLLVLIDGRAVYSPLFSGVFWDAQDVMLEDLERIEVISGPGSTLWGVNAVNGVINVITKSAKDTQGGLVAAGSGNRDTNAALRYGGKFGDNGHYRVYGKTFHIDQTATAAGTARNDGWHKGQLGFRTDWNHGGSSLTVNGNAYSGEEGQPQPGVIVVNGLTPPLGSIPLSGLNLTARWSQVFADGSNLTLQGYFDRTERTMQPSFSESLDVVDVQVQHSLRATGIHALVWGAEYRRGNDRIENSTFLAFAPARPFFGFLPANVKQAWSSVFAQDEMTLRKDLRLTVGARLERNDYTGTEFLPSARIAWKPAAEHLLWGAASRTVRAPSRFDRDVFIPAVAPFLLAGGPDVRSEVAKVYEIGYRGQPASRVTFSMTLFHTIYDHLRTQELAPSRTFFVFGSEMEGRSSGAEMWGTVQATGTWRLSGGVRTLREKLRLKPGSTDVSSVIAQQGADPSNGWTVRSSHTLPYRSEFDISVRHVSGMSSPAVPAYTAVDLRLGWKAMRDTELSLIGQNLLSNGHAEWSDIATRTQVGRTVYLSMLHRF
jgi:iron complex outermembrane receptor protein